MEGIQTFKGSWPWPWIRPYGIPMHHSSTSTYIPNFIEIEETFCGWTDGHFPPSNIIRSTFGSRPNKIALISKITMKNYTKTKIDRSWFCRLLQQPASKWSGSILTTPEPTWGKAIFEMVDVANPVKLIMLLWRISCVVVMTSACKIL